MEIAGYWTRHPLPSRLHPLEELYSDNERDMRSLEMMALATAGNRRANHDGLLALPLSTWCFPRHIST